MVLAGLAVLAWQFWGTNWVSQQRQEEVAGALQEGCADGDDTVTTDFGRGSAILHVPRWGKDYAVPVLEGSSDEVLAAGIGHLEVPFTEDWVIQPFPQNPENHIAGTRAALVCRNG
jgi:sortase A